MEVENCKFYNNNAGLDTERGGGAIYTKSLSVLKVTDSYFENNTAVNQGGAISNLLSDMTIINCIFKNNRTTDVVGIDPSGGAIYVDGARGDNGIIIIRNTSFEGNTCINGQGGALFLFPYRNQVVDLIGCTFKNNSSNMGGGVWHQGGGSGGIFDTEYPLTSGIENTTLNFHDCVFDGNTSVTQGGGIWLSRCKMNEIYNLTFKNNVSGLGGGFALLSDRFVTVRNSTFNNNSAGISGAIWPGINARLDIINCTFTSNIASSYGGAMSLPKNDATRPVNITNCTFANNQGNNPGNGQGAAIHSGTENSPNTTVTIKNNIFSNNTVTNNYGVWRDCNGILNDGGNNIFFPAGVGQNCVTTPNFVNPLLGPLANNGGPTQTMALLVGSPAIDAGSGCPTLDQRGGTRINTCDVGAYEYNATLGNDDYNLASQTLKLYPNPAVNGKIRLIMQIHDK